MGSRWILFGYRMECCKYLVVPSEAKTVVRIFEAYINGKTLKDIAEELTVEQIVYNEGKTVWNKIIENAHYAGDSIYPQIVNNETFQLAFNRKNALGGKREKDTAEIKYLKSVLYCAACGGRIRRIAKYTPTHEKWFCENNCKLSKYFDDNTLFGDIQSLINSVIINPNLLDTGKIEYTYEPSIETIRKEKEIRYMMDQSNVQFKPIQKTIFDFIQSKFDCCVFDSSVYTEPLKEYMKTQNPTDKLNIKLLALTAKKIMINTDGSITIHFINGKEILSAGRDSEPCRQ